MSVNLGFSNNYIIQRPDTLTFPSISLVLKRDRWICMQSLVRKMYHVFPRSLCNPRNFSNKQKGANNRKNNIRRGMENASTWIATEHELLPQHNNMTNLVFQVIFNFERPPKHNAWTENAMKDISSWQGKSKNWNRSAYKKKLLKTELKGKQDNMDTNMKLETHHKHTNHT